MEVSIETPAEVPMEVTIEAPIDNTDDGFKVPVRRAPRKSKAVARNATETHQSTDEPMPAAIAEKVPARRKRQTATQSETQTIDESNTTNNTSCKFTVVLRSTKHFTNNKKKKQNLKIGSFSGRRSSRTVRTSESRQRLLSNLSALYGPKLSTAGKKMRSTAKDSTEEPEPKKARLESPKKKSTNSLNQSHSNEQQHDDRKSSRTSNDAAPSASRKSADRRHSKERREKKKTDSSKTLNKNNGLRWYEMPFYSKLCDLDDKRPIVHDEREVDIDIIMSGNKRIGMYTQDVVN